MRANPAKAFFNQASTVSGNGSVSVPAIVANSSGLSLDLADRLTTSALVRPDGFSAAIARHRRICDLGFAARSIPSVGRGNPDSHKDRSSISAGWPSCMSRARLKVAAPCPCAGFPTPGYQAGIAPLTDREAP